MKTLLAVELLNIIPCVGFLVDEIDLAAARVTLVALGLILAVLAGFKFPVVAEGSQPIIGVISVRLLTSISTDYFLILFFV
jgi:hypothetical protein